MANSASNVREGETQLSFLPKNPLEMLHADHFGPLQETCDKYKHVLVLVDTFTRFTWLFAVKSTRSNETIKQIEKVTDIFGTPVEIVTDRGTRFTSKEFTDFYANNKIRHRKVAVAAPWANGIVERVNRFLKSSLTKLLDSPTKWKTKLGTAQYIINNTYHSVIKSSSAKLMLGFEQRKQIFL